MRGPSSALVTTANQNSAINVLFDAQSIGNVRILSFHQGSTLKSIKNFRTFSLLNFGQCHGVILSLQPIRNILEKLQETCKTGLFTSLCLSSRAGSLLPLFTYVCRPGRPSLSCSLSFCLRTALPAA